MWWDRNMELKVERAGASKLGTEGHTHMWGVRNYHTIISRGGVDMDIFIQ